MRMITIIIWIIVILLLFSTVTKKQECSLLHDINCDDCISRSELGFAITQWLNGQTTRMELGFTITKWLQGCVIVNVNFGNN